MMRVFLTGCVVLLTLTGCATHQELKAPCGPIAYAGAGDPCGELVPVNVVQMAIPEGKRS